jgi:SAM-dependent methyltransferase
VVLVFLAGFKMAVYGERFYVFEGKTGIESARVVVPLVLQFGSFKSVLDLGCGVGGWLKVFGEQGVLDLVGVDGPWIKNQKLMISKTQVLAHDLAEPLILNRAFDLVVSLETAEHLPHEKAEIFVNSLVTHGDVVLFSAAIPGQGGTQHVNEQWPSFWAELFRKHGFVVVDCLRREVWDNQQVAFWYAQNIMFYINKTKLAKYPKLQAAYVGEKQKQLNIVHPILFEGIINAGSLVGSVRLFWKALKGLRK